MPTTAPGLSPARAKLVQLMNATARDQAAHSLWTYLAVRPQAIPMSWKAGQRVVVDCSDGCRALARWAGIHDDPAGNGYASFGNSSSIWVHLHHAPLELAQPGDIFTFGYYAGEKHACMALDAGGNPRVWNMGRPGQPEIRRLSDEIAAHRGMTVTLCKLNAPDPPPTTQDLLRAHTDFWSWLAWSLGEGPWKPYGASNPKVRPNVGKVIAVAHPTWWARRAQFVGARNKGNKATSK